MKRSSKLIYDKERKIYHYPITEENIVTEIIQRLSWNQIKIYRVAERIPGMSKRLSTPGIPDLIGWVKKYLTVEIGKLEAPTYLCIPVFLEVKKPGGARRTAQIQFIEGARSDGAIAGFVESWNDVRELFKEFGIELPCG